MPRLKPSQRQRFGAIRHGDLSNGFGFSPRNHVGDEWLRDSELAKRQAEQGFCPSGQHSCEDIGRPNNCCDNDEFCFISNTTDKDGTLPPSCCKTGNDCAAVNPCPVLDYVCISTITLTIDTSSPIVSSPSVTELTTCCPRACETSAFQCPSSLGHGCCRLGQSCMPGGQCGTYIAPPTTVVSAADPRCTATGQFWCDDGVDGCCPNGAICTVVTGEGKCASASATATGSRNPGNFTEVVSDPQGLSSGAKAGIGIGVTGAVLLIVFATWWFIRRRRRAVAAARSEGSSTVIQSGVPMSDTHASPGAGGAAGGARWRRERGAGGAQDYFGPRATAGPYTENMDNADGGPDGVSPGQWGRGAVPISPQGPGDIVPAVEIGGSERRAEAGDGTPVRASATGTHRRQESQVLEEVGNDEGGIESAPPYGEYEESRVEVAQDRRARGNTLADAKDVPDDPGYRHELP